MNSPWINPELTWINHEVTHESTIMNWLLIRIICWSTPPPGDPTGATSRGNPQVQELDDAAKQLQPGKRWNQFRRLDPVEGCSWCWLEAGHDDMLRLVIDDEMMVSWWRIDG